MKKLVTLLYLSSYFDRWVFGAKIMVLVIVYFQIANLKAALARKEGEPDIPYLSTLSSPERQRMNSAGSSPSHPRLQSARDVSANRRQPTEDVGNLEVSIAHYLFTNMWYMCVYFVYMCLSGQLGL